MAENFDCDTPHWYANLEQALLSQLPQLQLELAPLITCIYDLNKKETIFLLTN